MAETDKDTETWLKRMSLATVIFAVSATLSTFKGGSYSTQSVINQALASDQWAFYQAKSMKQHLFELQSEQLKLQLEALPAGNPARADYETRIAELKTQIERYGREKHDIEAKARELEAQRDEAKRHNQPFGIAVLLLQVTILLSSIASLMKAKRIWWAALPVGAVGLVYFADGFVGWF
ncbi:DUF4337 domain-containing protein [Rubrivivax gelatinosus]|uniref:Putative transmembrane protein n=1 Tax=Rubrivivax gelatinosus (strain NBRC 100245 / IL144) TaxID=983917 RepID=I0HLM1_RUBGI|nr:DUF4337 domain-containing protein [Rubrivivax gelatinosus]BAL93908.1 putative transmembrane protein [Rubrivivax gelatinosus IL144]